MTTITLDDEERRASANLLTLEIQSSQYPLSPNVERLKRIRAKLTDEQPEWALSSARKEKPRR